MGYRTHGIQNAWGDEEREAEQIVREIERMGNRTNEKQTVWENEELETLHNYLNRLGILAAELFYAKRDFVVSIEQQLL